MNNCKSCAFVMYKAEFIILFYSDALIWTSLDVPCIFEYVDESLFIVHPNAQTFIVLLELSVRHASPFCSLLERREEHLQDFFLRRLTWNETEKNIWLKMVFDFIPKMAYFHSGFQFNVFVSNRSQI